jgi:hypothetical protein
MFQPGKETNIPTSSSAGGIPMPSWAGYQLASVNGFTLTLGLLILVVAGIWIWATLIKK